MDLLESLGAVWEEATGSPFDAGEVGQATMTYAEKNPRRFLFLVFICIYFVVYNWPLLTIIIYLFCCLIYQEMEMEARSKAENPDDWFLAFVLSFAFNLLLLFSYFLYQEKEKEEGEAEEDGPEEEEEEATDSSNSDNLP